jgi:hypothetical protein
VSLGLAPPGGRRPRRAWCWRVRAEHNLQGGDGGPAAAAPGAASPACRARARARWCRTCCTRRWLRHFGKATETPGAHERLLGADWLADAVFVDQSPIGKTARSQPGQLRRRLRRGARALRRRAAGAASAATAPGMFSFNAGDGRCPTCGGSASSTWRCSSSPTCTCAARTATAGATAPEILDVKIVRGPAPALAWPTCWSSP